MTSHSLTKVLFACSVAAVLQMAHAIAGVSEQDEFVLANEHISLKFLPPAKGGGISSIKNSAGYEFIGKPSDKPLWKMQLRGIATRKDLPLVARWTGDPEQDDGKAIGGADTGEAQASLEVSSLSAAREHVVDAKPDAIVFSWKGIDAGDEKGVVDVTIEVRLAPQDRFARFQSRFVNRSATHTVFYFFSPMVHGLYPADGKPSLDRLAIPCHSGRLVINPSENGILGSPTRLQPNRSGHSMQFDAYYHEGNGLYLGCFDENDVVKRYFYAATATDGLQWAMINVPNNMRQVPQTWETPYPTVLRCFEGDWYDACKIYREWALKQHWTREGPIHSRASTPQWFKDVDAWFMGMANESADNNLLNNETVVKALDGVNIGLIVYNWGKGGGFDTMTPEWFPVPDTTTQYVKWAEKRNLPLMGYIQEASWDTDTECFNESNGIDNLVRNYHNQIICFPKKEAGSKGLAITYPGAVWTKVLGDSVTKMAETGFKAVYLDSGNHAGTYMNFTPTLSSDSGGGDSYIKGTQEVERAVKDRARKIFPGFCSSAESFWEGNMAVLDAYLNCNTTNQFLKKGQAEAIPLVNAVYHDYMISYAAWVNKFDCEDEAAMGYVAKFGQLFVWGEKSGFDQTKFFTKFKNSDIALDTSVKRYHAYAAAKKFLLYGTMLRQPRMLKELPQIDVKWHISWNEPFFDVALPAVLHSVWRAPDGALGVVAYNIDVKPHTITMSLGIKEYGLADGARYSCVPLYPKDGTPLSLKNGKDGYVFEIEIPPRVPMVYELVADGAAKAEKPGDISVGQDEKRNVVVVNKGVGGNNTDDALKRFDKDVLLEKPTHLIIGFGMNDALNSAKLIPLPQYEENLQKLIDSARRSGIQNIILVTPNPAIESYVKKRHPNHPVADLGAHLAKYAEAVCAIAAHNNLHVADLRKLVEGKGGATEEKSSLLRNTANSNSEDGVHLTAEAYRLMAELFIPLLKDTVKPGDVIVCFGDSITFGANLKGAGTIQGENYPSYLSEQLNHK